MKCAAKTPIYGVIYIVKSNIVNNTIKKSKGIRTETLVNAEARCAYVINNTNPILLTFLSQKLFSLQLKWPECNLKIILSFIFNDPPQNLNLLL